MADRTPKGAGRRCCQGDQARDASPPLIASVYALAGNTSSITYGSFPYLHAGALFDVTSGTNGHCRRAVQLCTAEPGWDGPTGNGTPNATGGF